MAVVAACREASRKGSFLRPQKPKRVDRRACQAHAGQRFRRLHDRLAPRRGAAAAPAAEAPGAGRHRGHVGRGASQFAVQIKPGSATLSECGSGITGSPQGRKIMNRRTKLVLAGITLMGWMASPQLGFAQSESDPFLGVWQLNVAKSKFSPGPPPKSQTMYIWEDEAKIRKNSQVTINGAGVPNAVVAIHIYDDTPRTVPGAKG